MLTPNLKLNKLVTCNNSAVGKRQSRVNMTAPKMPANFSNRRRKMRTYHFLVMVIVFAVGFWAGITAYQFYIYDKCLDRGGANDAVIGVCIMRE